MHNYAFSCNKIFIFAKMDEFLLNHPNFLNFRRLRRQKWVTLANFSAPSAQEWIFDLFLRKLLRPDFHLGVRILDSDSRKIPNINP